MSAYFQYENPFDFLASLIARLPELDPELYYHPDKRNALPDIDRWSTSAHTLLVTSPEFSVDGLLRYGMQTDTVNQLNAWCTQDPDFPHIFSMACELDHILFWENILMSPYVTVDLKDGFKALNENAEETGILILPRVPSLNDPLDRADLDPDGNHKTWASDWEAGINEELTNTYYIRRDDLAVMNWRYVAEHRVVRNLVVGKQICLAFSPIAKRAQLLDPHCCKLEEGCRFSVPGLRDPELIHARVRAAYKAAAQEKADILIFPEMLGDAAMFDPDKTYSEFFTSLGNGPALILPPTWWHDNRNQLYVLTGDGEQLCVQEKQNPFLYRPDGQDQGYLEDLRDTQPVVQVLHVPYVGRITFPICKDYLVPDYRGLLVKVLRSTLMLCPSYSQGKFSFDISAPSGLEYGCYTLWANTCSARPDQETPPAYVGLIAAPNGDPVQHLEPQCGGQCGSADDPCVFLVDIRRTGTTPEITVRPHICGKTRQTEKREELP